MRFWIKCTRLDTGEAYHVNISLAGGMRCDGAKTILEFVGSNAQTVDVSETPEEILAIHLGATGS